MIVPNRKNFPVVCVGGSAGSQVAYAKILEHLSSDTGAAIVIVNHITSVDAVSMLHKILPRHTRMPVKVITENLRVQPNHVFIIPPNCELHLLDGKFRLKPISKTKGWPNVITIFLRSLAQDWDGKLIAVIVSGLDGDGAEALRDIKEVGGATIAQLPDTAEWSDMPDSAIKTGHVDFVISAEGIAQKIAQIVAQAFPLQSTWFPVPEIETE